MDAPSWRPSERAPRQPVDRRHHSQEQLSGRNWRHAPETATAWHVVLVLRRDVDDGGAQAAQCDVASQTRGKERRRVGRGGCWEEVQRGRCG
jgi:hypothetical protein